MTSSFAAALELQEHGRLPEAEQLYQAILDADPAHREALLHLGVLRLQQAKAEDAIALFRRALAVDADSVEAHSNLATALHAAKRHGEAIACYEEALALDPGNAEANYGLATALHALERHEEAIACYRRALAADADYAEAELGLGAALQARRQCDEAALHFRRALDIDPDFSEAAFGLASVFAALGRAEDAVPWYERVIAGDPHHVEALSRLAVALQALDRHDDALRHHESALAARPDAERLLAYGTTLRETGRAAEARRCFERAVALEPRKGRAYLALFSASAIAADDPHLAAAESLARDKTALDDEQQATLHFALGKAYEGLGESERSFRHFLDGNRLKRRQIVYDEASYLGQFSQIAAAFDGDFMRSRQGQGDPSALPIFILGMPRSGSNLVEQILASHPQVAALGERHYFGEAVKALGLATEERRFPDGVTSVTADEIRQLAALYLERVATAIPAARAAAIVRVTDKLLGNFALAGLIHLALPQARILHTWRDPADTCLSCFTTVFADIPYACDLGELGRYYHCYEALMTHWRAVLPAGVMLDVRYEDVVANFEPQARRILAHCGLAWDDACLAFHQTERPVRSASMSQVHEPIDRSSVGRWRPAPDLLAPLLDGLRR